MSALKDKAMELLGDGLGVIIMAASTLVIYKGLDWLFSLA